MKAMVRKRPKKLAKIISPPQATEKSFQDGDSFSLTFKGTV
jgi:hypothetical protein